MSVPLNTNQYEHIIIGAGIAGLSAAYRLSKAGKRVLVLEKSDRLGGAFDSRKYKSSIYEFGPNTLLSNSAELNKLIEELGLETLRSSFKKSKRFLYLRKKLIEVPSGPQILISDLLLPQAKFRILLEPFSSRKSAEEDESVWDFIGRKFGQEAALITASFLQGVWGGDAEALSAISTLKKLKDIEARDQSILLHGLQRIFQQKKNLDLVSFPEGMQSLTERLTELIRAKGSEIITGAELVSLESTQKDYGISYSLVFRDKSGCEHKIVSPSLMLATKAYESAELLRNISPILAEELSGIEYAPIALVAYTLPKNLFTINAEINQVRKSHRKLEGFGYITGLDAGFQSLGMIWSSELFPERNLQDEYLMVSFLGGAKNPGIIKESGDLIQQRAIQEQITILSPWSVREITHKDFNLLDFKLIAKAIPQYNLGHQCRRKNILMELEKFPGLQLYGNYLDGVSVVDTISKSLGDRR